MTEVVVRRGLRRYIRDILGPVRDWILEHPGIDIIIVAIVTVLYWLLSIGGAMPDWIAQIPSAHRLIVYGALATIATLAAGTTNTAVASYQGGSGPINDELRRTQGRPIRRNFRSITTWLWIAALLSIAALLIDIDGTTKHPLGSADGAQYLFVIGVVLIVLKFARLAFLQDLFLRAGDEQARKGKKPGA